MREAINQNRTVQLVLLGVLLVGGGFLFMKVTKGSGSPSAAAPSTASAVPGVTGSGSTDSGGVAATAAPLDGSVSASSTGSASTDSAGSTPAVPANLIPGPSLPKSLLASYKRGNGVALLVVRAGGIDDAMVHHSVQLLHGVGGLSVYSTKAQHIARYAWITQGVNVTDLPALVVLLPRKLSKGVPTASVSYGFRDAASVLQAAKDALYRGPTHLSYHP
jgi:hypothetical protein